MPRTEKEPGLSPHPLQVLRELVRELGPSTLMEEGNDILSNGAWARTLTFNSLLV
jgi:hypothetical protein